MGKLTISMAIFNSSLYVYQRVYIFLHPFSIPPSWWLHPTAEPLWDEPFREPMNFCEDHGAGISQNQQNWPSKITQFYRI